MTAINFPKKVHIGSWWKDLEIWQSNRKIAKEIKRKNVEQRNIEKYDLMKKVREISQNYDVLYHRIILKANIGGILVSFAMIAAFLPSTWVGDCRTNVNATLPMTATLASMLLFGVGLSLSASPYMVAAFFENRLIHWSVLKNAAKADKFRHRLNALITGTDTWIFAGLIGTIPFAATVILPITIFFYQHVYDWENIQQWQTQATIECARLQHIDLPPGWINPWTTITPPVMTAPSPLPLPPPPF